MPPFRYEPYVNRHAATIGGLIQHGPDAAARALEFRGQAQGRAAEIGGQATAQAIQGIGAQVAGVMHDVMRVQLEQPRRDLEAIQLRGAKRAEAEDTATRKAFQDAKGDLPTAIKTLEQQGDYITAGKLRTQLYESHLKGLDETKKALDITGERFKQSSQLLQGVPGAPDPAAAYKTVLPQVRQIVGPQLGAMLPDDYDPAIVKQALTFGMTAGEVTAQRRQATAETTAALTQAVSKVDLVEKLTKSAARYAQTVDTQEEWEALRAMVEHLGGDSAKDVLTKFPAQYSPAAVQDAAKLLRDTPVNFQHETVLTTDANGKPRITEAGFNPTTNQWFAAGDTKTPLTNVRKFERDPRTGAVAVTDSLVGALKANPAIYEDLTDSVKSALWADPRMQGFAPPPKADKGASRATAERWRTTQLNKIDENLGNMVIDKAQADKARATVEASYQAQIGTPAAVKPPPVKAAAPGGAPTEGETKEIPGYPGTEQTFKGGKWIRTK
jgi:hypothetical protein